MHARYFRMQKKIPGDVLFSVARKITGLTEFTGTSTWFPQPGPELKEMSVVSTLLSMPNVLEGS